MFFFLPFYYIYISANLKTYSAWHVANTSGTRLENALEDEKLLRLRSLQDEKSLLGYFLMVATIQTFTPSDTLNEAKQEINDAKTMINILFLHKLLIYKRNHDLYKIFGVSSTLLFFFFLFIFKIYSLFHWFFWVWSPSFFLQPYFSFKYLYIITSFSIFN